jgi:hypothetical protein
MRGLLADLVLVAHTLFVLFVVGGFALIWIGHFRGWAWIGGHRFRSFHLAAITFVAIEGLIGMTCPLTAWEAALRGEAAERSFVARLLHAVVFHDFPEWVFTVAYVAFAVLTALTIRLVPMTGRPRRDRGTGFER